MKLSEWGIETSSSSDMDSQDNTAEDSDEFQYTITSNKECWWWRAKRWERRWHRKIGWKKRNRGKLSLLVFRNSQKEDTILYDDWHCEVDTLIQRGHAHKKIKLAVLDTLEGHPKWTAQVADMDKKVHVGRGSLFKILNVLKNSYGQSITYRSLIGELCSIDRNGVRLPKCTTNVKPPSSCCYKNVMAINSRHKSWTTPLKTAPIPVYTNNTSLWWFTWKINLTQQHLIY